MKPGSSAGRGVAVGRRATAWDGYPPARLAETWRVPVIEAWEAITSTNDRAAEVAREGAPHGTVIVADEQTAGRGRRGATWSSPARSGLWMSVVIRSKSVAGPLPLVVGVSCVDAIRTCAPQVAVAIKWPNDLVSDGRKVGGILCEAADDAVVAGIGINVRTPAGGFADEVRAIATSLEALGAASLARNVLGGAIVEALTKRLSLADPWGGSRADLAAADALRDHWIATEQAGTGWARGIDEGGALLLEREDGSRVRVISGSVRLADRRS